MTIANKLEANVEDQEAQSKTKADINIFLNAF